MGDQLDRHIQPGPPRYTEDLEGVDRIQFLNARENWDRHTHAAHHLNPASPVESQKLNLIALDKPDGSYLSVISW